MERAFEKPLDFDSIFPVFMLMFVMNVLTHLMSSSMIRTKTSLADDSLGSDIFSAFLYANKALFIFSLVPDTVHEIHRNTGVHAGRQTNRQPTASAKISQQEAICKIEAPNAFTGKGITRISKQNCVHFWES